MIPNINDCTPEGLADRASAEVMAQLMRADMMPQAQDYLTAEMGLSVAHATKDFVTVEVIFRTPHGGTFFAYRMDSDVAEDGTIEDWDPEHAARIAMTHLPRAMKEHREAELRLAA